MKKPVVLLMLAAPGLGGCFSARPSAPDRFPAQIARNVTQQPLHCLDDKKFVHAVGREADAAWERVGRAAGPHTFSAGHARGFREGFIDYVDAGGNGEPPYLPPFKYRLTKYRNDTGIALTEDWYAGFRHGAAVARASGLRERNLIPLPGPVVPASAPELVGDMAPGPVPPALSKAPAGRPPALSVLPPLVAVPAAKPPAPPAPPAVAATPTPKAPTVAATPTPKAPAVAPTPTPVEWSPVGRWANPESRDVRPEGDADAPPAVRPIRYRWAR